MTLRRLFVVVCLVAAASPLVGMGTSQASPAELAPVVPDEAQASAVPFTARGSVNQVYAYGVGAGTNVELLDAGGATIDQGPADTAGAKLFRKVPAGTGYQVRTPAGTQGDLTVTNPDQHPTGAFYDQLVADQPLSQGFGYITTRDGTKLSANVTFPNDGSPGPWPVLLNYSGYDPSQPGDPPREAAVYPYQGYVVVGVNLRGTTCSGGAFEFMEDLQATDGYDVVEQLARQSWSNGNVGMVGISYSGYSQLYVGATNPPSLDAIAPASPYSDTYSGMLYPGGILNDGFAVDWATEREADAKPRAHGWVRSRINNGDTTCAANQVMRLQAEPLLERIHTTPFADHDYDYLNTETFVHKIKMPTFLSSQWQDEQTGGSAANLVPLFDPSTKVYGNFTNGTHVEPMAPAEIYEQMVFIDLYVGKRIPKTSSYLSWGAPEVLAELFGAKDQKAKFGLPFNAWGQQGTYENALAYYEARPRIRISWENGGRVGSEGLPMPTYAGTGTSPLVTRHKNWPVDGTINEKLYLQPDGALAATPSAVPDGAARASSSYVYDETSKRRSTFAGGTESAWAPHPDYKWDVLKEGNALSFVTAPYAAETAYAGSGSVDLWLRSSAADTDLEATLTEVRPDGKEVFIQSGWLRASHRTEDPARSTELVPYHDHQEADASPLPAGQFTKVRLELFPFAHAIRAGSRLRVNIEAPGGNQPFWEFESLDGTAINEIGHSAGMASRVVLPKLPASATPNVPDALPACSLAGVTTQAVSLRNQPCRTYAPARVPTAVTATVDGGAVDVAWTAPPGAAPSGYRVVPQLGAGAPAGASAPLPVEVDGTTTAATFDAVPAGVPLEFRVIATFGSADAPASNASLPVVVDPLAKRLFGTWSAFVTRQLTDFTGAAPAADVQAGVAAIEGGQSAEAYVAALREGADATSRVDPMTRLYLAYFKRSPDHGGWTYWVRKRRAGTTLTRISDTFAASSEFKNTYGALSNRAFVQLVYQNVLGRPADAGGLSYWTSRLDRKVSTRGQVMLSFSESNEYKVASADRVDLVNLWLTMLRRPPTTAELTGALERLGESVPFSVIVAEVLASEEYAATIPAS